jgi:stearoyl-CoA desaturase (delta-9 desaturase)
LVGIGSVAVPAIAALSVPVFGWWPSHLDLTLCGAMYASTMFGITAGFHRCPTHGGFRAHPALKAGLPSPESLAARRFPPAEPEAGAAA